MTREPPTDPLRTVAIVIYATFALLIATIPQSMTNWLRDKETNPAEAALLQTAEAIESLSHRIGVDAAYRAARGIFQEWAGKGEN